jgi:hypothetical protein
MLFPLIDAVWGMFFRGIAFGLFAGFVLILLFLSVTGKYGALARVQPIGFVYFLAGAFRCPTSPTFAGERANHIL